MNMASLKRFQGELILLFSLIFVLFAYGYKYQSKAYVQSEKQSIEKRITQISEVSELKRLWGDKKIGKKLNNFKTIIPKEKVKSFEKRSHKMSASYQGLSVKELNKVVKQLFKMPVQITTLSIEADGKERYNMELKCKW